MTARPTVVFVPGAWHTPDCFDLVANSLQKSGYRTVLVRTPSVGAPDTIKTNEPDVAAIRAAIIDASDAGEDVLLFMHSYGGIPGSSAVEGLTKHDREQQGAQGGVSLLFFCCSWMLDKGECVLDKFGAKAASNRTISDDPHVILTPVGGPEKALYNDLSESVCQDLITKLLPQAFTAIYHSKVTYAAWRDLPTMYLLCKKDGAIKYEMQKSLVAKAEAAGAPIHTETLDVSHSPFLSVPEEVVASIKRFAGR